MFLSYIPILIQSYLILSHLAFSAPQMLPFFYFFFLQIESKTLQQQKGLDSLYWGGLQMNLQYP